MESYEQILRMVKNACNSTFYHGYTGNEEKVIECATQIYIEQMKLREGENARK